MILSLSKKELLKEMCDNCIISSSKIICAYVYTGLDQLNF